MPQKDDTIKAEHFIEVLNRKIDEIALKIKYHAYNVPTIFEESRETLGNIYR